MPYSQFTTITKVKEAFSLTTVEGVRFLPAIEPVSPSPILQGLLETNIPWAIATSTDRARSEAIINPDLNFLSPLHKTLKSSQQIDSKGNATHSLTSLVANTLLLKQNCAT